MRNIFKRVTKTPGSPAHRTAQSVAYRSAVAEIKQCSPGTVRFLPSALGDRERDLLRWAADDITIDVQIDPSLYLSPEELDQLLIDPDLGNWSVQDVSAEVYYALCAADDQFLTARRGKVQDVAADLAERAASLAGDAPVLHRTTTSLDRIPNGVVTSGVELRHVVITTTAVIEVTGRLPGLGRTSFGRCYDTYYSGHVPPGQVPAAVISSDVTPFAGRMLFWRDNVLSSGEDFRVHLPAEMVPAVLAATAVTLER